uniref:Retrovirus-related Pol polyprotein from transposon TNT 1-94 n=1 Tax=Cajanus cajan TaxID=3821 RepID=A0A151SI83_CAJCA|nr:Retrovirus-related Pol polyprotein from transposon TNT 1-94 [Cajanus cajan]
MDGCKEPATPISTCCNLDLDEKGITVENSKFRGIIGSLLYLTTSRPHIMFVVALVSWHSKKQACIALNTIEVEYIVAGICCAQILWMKQQLKDYGTKLNRIPLRCDNTSAINLIKNPILHSRTKHIEIRHHFLRDHVQKNDCVVEFVETNKQLANIFTKPPPKERYN